MNSFDTRLASGGVEITSVVIGVAIAAVVIYYLMYYLMSTGIKAALGRS